MSETASFVDPVFLAQFGLGRMNVLDYFLHPLNPFRTRATTSNEELTMQMMSIGTIMQYGTGTKPGPLSLEVAEEEYAACLRQFTGEQYELMPNDGHFIPPQLPNGVPPPESPLFTIRHVLRTNKNTIKVLGIYYVMEGVIYKSPNVRSLMKSIVTKTIDGLSEACDALSKHARYEPSTGYTWYFDDNSSSDEEDEDHSMTFPTSRRLRLRKKRRILDNRRPGARTEEEEEGIRASEAIDRILFRIRKNTAVVGNKVL